MKYKYRCIITILYCLLSICLNAKTIHYVKNGATGDGSSWSNASGSIQNMIDKAMIGDEVWVSEGTYYPEKEYVLGGIKDRTFKLRPGVSLYGGFAGTERSLQERKKIDRDKNGVVESWEFQYETILSGEGNVKDIIIKNDDDQIEKMLNRDDNCRYVVSIGFDDYDENTISPCVSSFTVVSGVYEGIGVSNVWNVSGETIIDVIECDIYYNGNGLSFCRNVVNCNIHHNTGGGIRYLIAYNCYILKNKGSGAFNSSLYDCIIENNYADYDGGGTIYSNLYNCIVRDNFAKRNGGGTSNGSLENCKVYNNKTLGNGGGTYGGKLKNCEVYNNGTLGNGGGISDCTAINCSIFNNKAGEEGGGCGDGGYYYNCNIYNNYAPTYGGISSSSYVNCTIVNNKSFSGNENSGNLTNCIVVGTFDGSASYSAFTDSYVKGDGNFLATEKELKFVKSTSFIGNASSEKQLEELKNADFRLAKGSSAIDMGQQEFGISLLPEDYSGYPRPMGVKTDIGAHEYPSYRVLPYENKFDENSLSMNVPEAWKVEKLSGKEEYSLYYAGDRYNSQKQFNYITTPFFDKTASNKINLSFDISAKFKTMDQKEKMHIILAYLESDKRDTIMSYSNTNYIQDIRFSKEISSWVKNKVFRVLFAVEDSRRESSNIVYYGISNLKISKQDATVDIIAKDKVCMYDGKPQSVDFQINDTRVDKNKVVVTYQKEGSTQSSTTPPTNAGVYKVLISIEDGSYFGMKEVKLTIEKANQKILWEQKLTTMGTLEKIRLEATASSGLPVQYSVDDELLAKIEKIDKDWWLVSDTLIGNVTVKASQPGNENYNLANSVLKTIKVYSNLTDIAEIETNNLKAYYLKEGNSIRIEGAPIGCKVYVYDTLGHLYTSKEMIYGEDQIQMRNTSGGIYYLLFVDKDKKRTIKVLTD